MSSSRKLKFRTVPRAPRYPHNKHAEPVPLASKFQELIEQDELSPSQSRVPVQLPLNTAPTISMAQRLQDLLAESASGNERSCFDVDNDVQVQHGVQNEDNVSGAARSRGAEALWNGGLDTVDSDTSDHEDWTKSSAKVVLPMGQRLHEFMQEDNLRSKEDDSRSKQDKLKQRQKGKRPIVSNLEPRSVSKEDDIEACDNTGTPTYPDVQIGTPNPPLVSIPQPLPRIAEQFQEALLAAPSFDSAPSPSVQFPVNQDYSTRLQRILQLEKQQHAEITKGPPLSTSLDSLQVEITKKSLEGRLTTCNCQVIQAPSKWMGPSSSSVDQVQVVFNSKVAAELEIDVGRKVQINPPWRELTLSGSTTRVILCTYFCEPVH